MSEEMSVIHRQYTEITFRIWSPKLKILSHWRLHWYLAQFHALPYSLLFTVFEAVLKRFQRFSAR